MAQIMVWRKLEVKHGDRTLSGSYAYNRDDMIVEVRSDKGGYKASQLGDSRGESLARLMLRELADEGKA